MPGKLSRRAQAQLLKSVGKIARVIYAKWRLTTEGLRCRSSDVSGTATHTLFLSSGQQWPSFFQIRISQPAKGPIKRLSSLAMARRVAARA
jgi:hypothetical protein